MGQQQSKDELLHQQVSYGNVEGIKSLRRDGAGLEWVDKEGKTPLILACMNPELFDVAKTLIELGSNVNSYRAGRHAGTPLHHAAKRGLENTVKLLLSHGANPLVLNDDCQTPLEVARAKGFGNVVRAIENHICLFSGWMREFYGPGLLEVFVGQLLTRKIWAVILPSGSRSATTPFKLELAIYSSLQDSQPRAVIALWKANLEEPNPNQADPTVIIHDNSTKTRIKLATAIVGNRQQLKLFCDACKGIPQPMHPVFLHNSRNPVVEATAPLLTEDQELARAINASLQSSIMETPNFDSNSAAAANAAHSSSHSGPSTSMPPALWKTSGSGLAENESGISAPSAPVLADDIMSDGPIHYPSIDSDPVEFPIPQVEKVPNHVGKRKGDDSTCVICLDAPSEAACVPCGHVAGCMSCLNEIKAKNWGCPVCRAKVDQIMRIYHV